MILNALKLKRQARDDFKGRHFEATLIVQGVEGVAGSASFSGFVNLRKSECRPLKSPFDRHFSLRARAFRIMGQLRGWSGKLGGYG